MYVHHSNHTFTLCNPFCSKLVGGLREDDLLEVEAIGTFTILQSASYTVNHDRELASGRV
jgi:hypothetical protein